MIKYAVVTQKNVIVSDKHVTVSGENLIVTMKMWLPGRNMSLIAAKLNCDNENAIAKQEYAIDFGEKIIQAYKNPAELDKHDIDSGEGAIVK